MKCLRFSLVLAITLTLAVAGAAQQSTRLISDIASKDSSIKMETRLVSVPVSVVDREGHFKPGLDSSNFEVYDDGVKQKIEFFSSDDSPLSIGIVYDLSGSMQSQRKKSLAALEKFLAGLRPVDEFFSVGVSTKPMLLNDYTNNPEAVSSNAAFRETRGKTALFDAIYLAMEKIRQGKSKRKMLIVISDGQDNNSRYAFRDLRNYIQESDVQLYAVGTCGIWGFHNELAFQGRAILRDLTSLTGGKVIFAPDDDQLETAFDIINAEMRSQYSLGFNVPNSRDARWHKLKIKLVNVEKDRAKSLTVTARQGYQNSR